MVETYNMIISKNARVYGSAHRNTLVAPAFYAVFGAIFVGFSLFEGEGLLSLLGLLGIGFLAFGAWSYYINRRTFGRERNVA